MRIVFLFITLLSGALIAQESPSRDGRANRDPNANASAVKEYSGCVIRSGGKIVLADPAGKEYSLYSREGRDLSSYVGQEVQLTASDVNPGDQSSDERSVNSGQIRNGILALNVEQIQKIADKCRSPE